MKRFTLFTAMLAALLTFQFANAQTGFGPSAGGDDTGVVGEGGHMYPDLYPGSFYQQLNPAASGYALIDRSDEEDYPTIYFSDATDFFTSIAFEEDNWAAFFPLGVNLVEIDFESGVVGSKFVFEPSADQFLFEDGLEAVMFQTINPVSTAFFGTFQQAQKQVKQKKGDGHHIVNSSNWPGYPKAATDVWDLPKNRIRDDYYTTHKFGTFGGISHKKYNDAVKAVLDAHFAGKDKSKITAAEAQAAVTAVKKDPLVKKVNAAVKAEKDAAAAAGKAAHDAAIAAGKTKVEAKKAGVAAGKIAGPAKRKEINDAIKAAEALKKKKNP